MTAHRPEEALGALETAELGRAEQPLVDQLGGAFYAEHILADPVQRVEVAKAAFTVLDVGLDDVSAIAHAAMALVPLGELGRDIVARGTGDDFGLEPPHRVEMKLLIAPQPSALEQRGADRHIVPGGNNHLIGRADRLADLQIQVPQDVKQRLDHLVAPWGSPRETRNIKSRSL